MSRDKKIIRRGFKVKTLIIEDEMTNPVYTLKNTTCAFAVNLLNNLYIKKKVKKKYKL